MRMSHGVRLSMWSPHGREPAPRLLLPPLSAGAGVCALGLFLSELLLMFESLPAVPLCAFVTTVSFLPAPAPAAFSSCAHTEVPNSSPRARSPAVIPILPLTFIMDCLLKMSQRNWPHRMSQTRELYAGTNTIEIPSRNLATAPGVRLRNSRWIASPRLFNGVSAREIL